LCRAGAQSRRSEPVVRCTKPAELGHNVGSMHHERDARVHQLRRGTSHAILSDLYIYIFIFYGFTFVCIAFSYTCYWGLLFFAFYVCFTAFYIRIPIHNGLSFSFVICSSLFALLLAFFFCPLSQQCTPPLCCCFIVGCCQYTADAVTLTDVALLLLPLHARYCNIFSRYIMTVLMMISQLLQWPFDNSRGCQLQHMGYCCSS